MGDTPLPTLYRNLYRRLSPMTPDASERRLRNLVYLMMGIICGRSVQLGRIAVYIPLRAKKLSIVRRMERFLDNGSIRVRVWYEPVARGLLSVAAVAGEVHLLIDCTKVSFNHQLLMVALAYRRRALPIAWTWVRCRRGHSTVHKQLALLAYVRGLLPAEVRVSLVGDCEFGHGELLHQLSRWQWDYVLRQPGQVLVALDEDEDWQRLDSLIRRPGTWSWFGNVRLMATHQFRTHLMVCWKRGCDTPWLLATNLTKPLLILRYYHRRAWIEGMFADLKGQGFDLERSHLRTFLHLSRLTLAVALLYVWLIAFGADLVASGLRAQVDRTNRRDLSLFRIAWDYLQRLLIWSEPFEVSFVPIFGSLPAFSPAGYLLSGS